MRENVNSPSSSVNSLEWRRSKVLELSSQGRSQPEIARILQVSQPTVNRDIRYLGQQAQENLQKHIQEKLPEEYQRCLTGMNQVLKLSWDIANKPRDGNLEDNGQTMIMTDDKTRLQALSLINDCYKYIMDLTTNGVVITDAIRFVQSNKEKLISKKENNGEEAEGAEGPDGPDYEEDQDQSEEKREEEKGELGELKEKSTINQVF